MATPGVATIGVDAHTITGKYQGSRTYILNILRQLGEIDGRNRYIVYSFDQAVTERLLPFANFTHKTIALRSPLLRLLFYWPQQQSRERIDFLLTQYMAPLLFARQQMVAVHDILFESHPQFFTRLSGLRNKALVRLSAKRSAVVFALSEATRGELIARYRLPPEKVLLTYAGIDPAQAGPFGDRSPAAALRPYVLSVGRLEPRKNIATLLAAFRRMRTPGVKLVIIGKEDFRAADVAAAIRAAPGVVHLQDVPDAELPLYYRDASVFAFPTHAEGFGIPVLEALVHGTPVVTSDHPALREAGGSLARYFDPARPDADAALAALLDEAIASPPAWSEEQLAAHLDQFSWRRSAQTVLGFIEGRNRSDSRSVR